MRFTPPCGSGMYKLLAETPQPRMVGAYAVTARKNTETAEMATGTWSEYNAMRNDYNVM